MVRIPGLAHSLLMIGQMGVDDFYRGDLSRAIAHDIEANHGILTIRDLEAYAPVVRAPARIAMSGWKLATNPSPAIGGCALAALLAFTGDSRGDS